MSKNITLQDDHAGIDLDELKHTAIGHPNCTFTVGRWKLFINGKADDVLRFLAEDDVRGHGFLEGSVETFTVDETSDGWEIFLGLA
jgi:hypothetical protein